MPRLKVGNIQVIVPNNYYQTVCVVKKYLKDFIMINTIAPISCENMLGYMSFKDTICSLKLAAFLKLHAQKTVPKTQWFHSTQISGRLVQIVKAD